MAYTLVTYAALLDDYCQHASVGMNATTGAYEPTVKQQSTFARLLTDACDFIWRFGSRQFILPSLMEVATVTPTDGVIARASVQDTSKWSVWTQDPRSSWSANDGLWRTYRLLAVPDTDGLRVEDATEDSELTVFFQRETPLFDHRAWDTGQSYVVDDVRVHDGQCYKCLTTHTSGTFSTDLAASKWRLQQIPAEMAQVIKAKLIELRAGNVSMRSTAQGRAIVFAENLLDELYLSVANSAPPWLAQNGGL